MSTQDKEKTSFFDLSLELRQHIYDLILPSDCFITLKNRQWTPSRLESTVDAVCKADPRLSLDLWPWCRKHCGARYILTTKPSYPPTDFVWPRLRKIEIDLEYSANEFQWTRKLRNNLQRLISAFKDFACLQDVAIKLVNGHCGAGLYWTRTKPKPTDLGVFERECGFAPRILAFILDPLLASAVVPKLVLLDAQQRQACFVGGCKGARLYCEPCDLVCEEDGQFVVHLSSEQHLRSTGRASSYWPLTA